MQGRDYVDPEDVRAIAPDVLRHRLKLSYEAQGEGVAPDRVVAEIIKQVALP
jgi:MoxR-like ATPase